MSLSLGGALVLCLFAASIQAAKTDIKVDFDKSFSFAGVKTWAWHPDGKGDVKLAISSQQNPERVAARVEPVIVPTIEQEMAGKALTVTTPDQADVLVRYYVLAVVGQSAQVMGQFLPAVPQWGIPPFNAATQSLEIYPVGTLIIDISSRAKQAIVWRGAAERKLDVDNPDEERRKNLERAVRDLLKRFPPKK